MKLHIKELVYGGAGRAKRPDGAGALVPFTLPGEVVEVREAAVKGEAELVQVVEASAERVAAGCRHFGACGGCQLQHATYAAQVRMKAEMLGDILRGAGVSALPEVQVHTGEPWGYRNRVRFRVGEVDGAIRLGYNRPGSHAFLAIEECPIAAPQLWWAGVALLELAKTDAVVERWVRAAVEVELFASGDETKLQMTLFVRKAVAGDFKGLCERLKAVVPELTGAGISVLPKEGAGRSRRMERATVGATWGAAGLLYGVAGTEYWVSRGGFFQVNRFLVETMVRLATAGRRGRMAWDLYAGVGLFSRALAAGCEQVVAVEGGEVAAADLAAGLKGEGMRAVCASTADFLRGAVIQRERPDLLVMDPPRAGLGAEVCALLARLKVAEMVYVSCDPVTLARDLKALGDAGYGVEELHMVDMFPQTFHVETVAILRR